MSLGDGDGDAVSLGVGEGEALSVGEGDGEAVSAGAGEGELSTSVTTLAFAGSIAGTEPTNPTARSAATTIRLRRDMTTPPVVPPWNPLAGVLHRRSLEAVVMFRA